MPKKLENMSIDDLTAEIVRLSNEREALRDQQKVYSDRRDALLTEQYTRERLTAAGFAPEQVDEMAKRGIMARVDNAGRTLDAIARVNTIDVSAKEGRRG